MFVAQKNYRLSSQSVVMSVGQSVDHLVSQSVVQSFSQSVQVCFTGSLCNTEPFLHSIKEQRVLLSTFFGASACHKQGTCVSTWKDQIHLEGPWQEYWVHLENIPTVVSLDPNIQTMVVPGTDWSFQVLTQVPYL